MATDIIKSHDMKTMFPMHHKKNKRSRRQQVQSVGIELDIVEGDKVTKTNNDENKRRRTIILQRADNASWGFTLQSYGIHHRDTKEVEILTYVDYVEYGAPGYLAGLQPGDVILSINGTNMEEADHNALVLYIKNCGSTMRMVVLFEDCCRKVDLHLRYIRLKRVLAEKIFEVRSLEQQEKRVLAGMSRFDSRRSSIASSLSSLSSVFDDRLSLQLELDSSPYRRNFSSCSEELGAESPAPRERAVTAPHMLPVSPLALEAPEPDFETLSMKSQAHSENSPFMRDSESMSSLMSTKSAQPFFGPRFDFDRSSLPVNHRLKPQLRAQNTFPLYQNGNHFSPAKRPTSMRVDRSGLLRDALSPDFQKGIPEDRACSLRRHASTPENIGDTNNTDLYRYSINNNARLHGYSDENLSGKFGVRPKEKMALLPNPVRPPRRRRYRSEEVKTKADIHYPDKLNSSAPASALKAELHNLPLKARHQSDIPRSHRLTRSASDEVIGMKKIELGKTDSSSMNEDESGLDPSDIEITLDTSGSDIFKDLPTVAVESASTSSSNGANDNIVDPSDIVFTIGDPMRSSSPVLLLSSTEENSESSVFVDESSVHNDSIDKQQGNFLSPTSCETTRVRGHSSLSTMSRFSYSDLPCMDKVFVNENDEVTKL